MFIEDPKMEFILENVEAKIDDVDSDNIFFEVNQTIVSNLNEQELKFFRNAIQKVSSKKILNRNDLKIFDKIDALTMEHHKMCLKCSLLTKARVEACEKFKIPFNDRDGLQAHMKLIGDSANTVADSAFEKFKMNKKLAFLLIDKFGEPFTRHFPKLIAKIFSGSSLNKDDLKLIASVEKILNVELKASMFNKLTIASVLRAEVELGLDFDDICDELN
jgi:hypothetical protein